MFLFDLPGAVYEVIREWLTWSGRYTYHFLAVFLGRAAASPLCCGFVCAFVLFTYGLAFFKLGRLVRLGVPGSINFSLAALCVIMALHGNLQDFYLFTDALTIVLQAACYFLFLSQIFELWQSCNLPQEKPVRRLCIFWGIVSIGIYEHAALAVFWTISAALFSTCFESVKKVYSEKLKSLRKSLLTCFFWLSCAIIFSFFAPGNLVRKNARNVEAEQVWTQLRDIPEDLLSLLMNFLSSPWPLGALCLAVFALLFSSQHKETVFPGKALAFISLSAFFFFSVSVNVLHALSDVPLLSESKLRASLEIYAAVSLGLVFFFLPWQKFLTLASRRIIVSLSCLLFTIICGLSDNFLLCAENAANGQMLLYRDFMETRENWLAKTAASLPFKRDKFGLIGEIENPETRRRKARPEQGATIVQSFPRAIFPVHMLLGLSDNAEVWPNLWAAWVYGLGAIAELPPDPQRAIAAVKTGKGKILKIPTPILEAGITEAWLVEDSQNSNPTFNDIWLILLASKPLKLKFLLPSTVSGSRLMPLFLQNKEERFFDQKEQFGESFFTGFFSIPLAAEIKEKRDLTAIWLAPFREHMPNYFFASVNDLVYHKLIVLKSF